MASKRNFSESVVLEQYRVALENATAQPEVSAELEEFGYDATKLSEGSQLLQATRIAFDSNQRENSETTQASLVLGAAREILENSYSSLRKRAKVVFMNDTEVLKRLELDHAISDAYTPWLESVTKFCNNLKSDATLLPRLARLKVTPAQVDEALAQIDVVNKARAEYLRESGESQAATQVKDEAFVKIDKWMSEFYAVARIALEDKPQLLEVLGKKVKN